MLIVSDNLVPTESQAQLYAGTPIIAWRNLVTPTNVTATSEDPDFPAANLSDPSTVVKWKGLLSSPPADDYVICDPVADEIDYVALVRHNLGSAEIPVSVEAYTDLVGSPPQPDWFEIIPEVVLTDDAPVVFRFTLQSVTGIRVRMQPGLAAPTAAVLMVGRLLIMERGVDIRPDTPPRFGRKTNRRSGNAESGDYLGNIVTGSHVESNQMFSNLTADWFREEMDEFIVSTPTDPFIYIADPDGHPDEVAYMSTIDDPEPEYHHETGRFSVELRMRGLVE